MPDARRDFYKLWVGQAISEVGSRITREGLPLTAALVLNATPSQMGYLAAAGGGAVLLFSMGAGMIADRWRRRPLMLGADALRALLLATIPAAAFAGVLSYAQLLAVAVLTGVLTVQFDVAYQSYLPSLVPREDLLEGNRKLTMTASLAEIVGPSLTGLLVQLITAPIAILFDALSFAVSAISLWLIRTPEPAPAPAAAHDAAWDEALAGARAVAAHPVLRWLALRAMAAFFSMGAFFSLYILFAIRVLHLNTASLGLIIALGGAGSLAGAWLSNRVAERLGAVRAVVAASLAAGLINLLVPLAAVDLRFAVVCLGAAQLFGDAAWSINFIAETTYRQQQTPDHLLGRVNAAMQFASRGMLPLGGLAAGLLAERIGITPTLWIGMAGLLGSVALLIPAVRNEKAGLEP